MGRVAALVAAIIALVAPVYADEPGTWSRDIELPTYVGEGPFVTVPANIIGMPTMIVFGAAATALCTPFDLLRGLSVGGGYGTVASACAAPVAEVAGSAAYIIGGAPFWVAKQVVWNGPRALWEKATADG